MKYEHCLQISHNCIQQTKKFCNDLIYKSHILLSTILTLVLTRITEEIYRKDAEENDKIRTNLDKKK